MTSEEARKQLDECENQITNTYNNLQKTAIIMGANTVQAARKQKATSAIFPLFTILFGIIICFISIHFDAFVLILLGHTANGGGGGVLIMLGIGLIFWGVFKAISSNLKALSAQEKIEKAVSNLNNSLNEISEI